MVGYLLCAYAIAAFVASTPFVVRGWPSGVVFGLCGSGLFTPAYTSWLQYETETVLNPAGSLRISKSRPFCPTASSTSRVIGSSFFWPAVGCGLPLASK